MLCSRHTRRSSEPGRCGCAGGGDGGGGGGGSVLLVVVSVHATRDYRSTAQDSRSSFSRKHAVPRCVNHRAGCSDVIPDVPGLAVYSTLRIIYRRCARPRSVTKNWEIRNTVLNLCHDRMH